MKWIKSTLLLLAFKAGTTKAQTHTDTLELHEVQIQASKTGTLVSESPRTVNVITAEDIRKMTGFSVAQILETALSVDIRQRSPGAQADMSMRGSSFEQTLLLIDGIPMTDPQTGHHQLNIPLSPEQIERIEIYPGGSSRIFGAKAFSGAINIITKKPSANQLALTAEGGDYGYYKTAASGILKLKHVGISSFINHQASAGYTDNTDFNNTDATVMLNGACGKLQYHTMGGITDHQFGALNFYTAAFPDQYEAIQARIINGGINYNSSRFSFHANGYHRQHFDRFELFREGDGWYQRTDAGFLIKDTDTVPSWYTTPNYHRTDVHGVDAGVSYTLANHTLSIGGSYRSESVISNVLGELMDQPEQVKHEPAFALYSRATSRNEINIYAEDQYEYNRWLVNAGAMVAISDDYGTRLFPGIDLSYRITKQTHVFGNINSAVRYPTFTDLYYNRGGAVGSKDLQPETALNYEAGIRYNNSFLNTQISVFRREGKNLIDWIRYNGEAVTKAANITTVNFTGADVSLCLMTDKIFPSIESIKTVAINYSWATADTASNNYESNYVLDYLRHKLSVRLEQSLTETWSLNWTFNYRIREGGYYKPGDKTETPFGSLFTLDVRLLQHTPRFDVFAEVMNMFNTSYSDIGNIQQPGRWVRAGITFRVVKP